MQIFVEYGRQKDSIGSQFPKNSQDSLTYDYNFNASGWHGMNQYGQLEDPSDEKGCIRNGRQKWTLFR